MRSRHGCLVLLVAVGACAPAEQKPTTVSSVTVDPNAIQAFQPLPASVSSSTNVTTAEKVALGRMLYYDTRVSASGDVSCYVCHPLHDYGTSHRRTGVGHNGLLGGRNEPTVYNAAGHVAQFWDGRAPDVEAQALGPVLNPVEMGMADGAAVMAVLRGIPGYVDAFRAAYPADTDPLTFENFGAAIGAFERGLMTPSRWDAFLEGDPTALTDDEKTGFNDFVSTGCTMCHSGAYVGGSLYQKAGLINPWYDQSDAGRFAVTGNPSDQMMFKVPSLRNVEETWPYFHDGSVQRMEEAVRLMAWHQLNQQLTESQVASISTWLKTLTGPVPLQYINEPTLPPTPAPEMNVGG